MFAGWLAFGPRKFPGGSASIFFRAPGRTAGARRRDVTRPQHHMVVGDAFQPIAKRGDSTGALTARRRRPAYEPN